MNYIQTFPAQIQKKVLRKILVKIFITKKCSQCKTSHTLKNLNYQIMKILENCLQNINCLFLDQAHFSFRSIPNTDTTIPHLYSFLVSLTIYFILANWNPFLTRPWSCSSSVSLFYPISCDHTPLLSDIPNQMLRQVNQISCYIQIIIPCRSNTQPIKKLSL